MVPQNHVREIKKYIQESYQGKGKWFIFGPAREADDFDDIDIGYIGKELTPKELLLIQETFEDSLFPFNIEITDFSKVEKKFYDSVLPNNVYWITK